MIRTTATETIILAVIAFFAGVFLTALILVGPLNHQNYHVMDLQAQLATCDSGREAIHHELHVMSDSVLLLERRK